MANTWNSLGVDELRKVAIETYGIEGAASMNKREIIAALVEEGASYDAYSQLPGAIVVDEVAEVALDAPVVTVVGTTPPPVETQVLLRMDRANPTYETHGFRFTKDNPFALVPETVANRIFRTETGFRVAYPFEAKEFYA